MLRQTGLKTADDLVNQPTIPQILRKSARSAGHFFPGES